MRILLVKPRWWPRRGGGLFFDFGSVPPLGLGQVAALSPPGCEVRIVDEDIEEVPFEEGWDLVGITAMTSSSRRAYEISERYRALGSKTVLGGVHPSIMPEEAGRHADAVAVGEAELTWPRIVEDSSRGRLQPIYRAAGAASAQALPFPRRDLFRMRKYWFDALQVTRGCANRCRFCYLHEVPWGAWSARPVEAACEELARTSKRGVFIVDDNLFVDHDYAKRFFRRAAPLRKDLYIQAPSTVAKDPGLLEAMADAGVFLVMVGFQAVSQAALDEAGVEHGTAAAYRETVAAIRGRGMGALGFFVFGFDSQEGGVFESTTETIEASGLDAFLLYLLTPYPGTRLHREFESQGRLLGRDFSEYTWNNCVFRPKWMSPGELERGRVQAYRRLNGYLRKTLPARAAFVLKNYWDRPGAALALLSFAIKGVRM